MSDWQKKVFTRVSQIDLARQLGISAQAVCGWKRSRVPAGRVLSVEAISGVPRYEIRPDIYPPPSSTRRVA